MSDAEYPEWILNAIKLSSMSVDMDAVVTCLRCREPLRRTVFNGHPVWDHFRHPVAHWPNTHCPVKLKRNRVHICRVNCKLHALPDIDGLLNDSDREFLQSLKIR
jgi:hypothetical protein